MEQRIYTTREIEAMKDVNWICGYCWLCHGIEVKERDHTMEHFKLYPTSERIKMWFQSQRSSLLIHAAYNWPPKVSEILQRLLNPYYFPSKKPE